MKSSKRALRLCAVCFNRRWIAQTPKLSSSAFSSARFFDVSIRRYTTYLRTVLGMKNSIYRMSVIRRAFHRLRAQT